MPPVDSSHSRIYLTQSNNPYENLHRPPIDEQTLNEVRARNDQLKAWKSVAAQRKSLQPLLKFVASREALKVSGVPSRTLEMPPGTGKELTEEEICALPLSSDDEHPVTKPVVAPKAQLPTPTSTQSPRSKRPLRGNANQTASKRRKMDAEDSESKAMVENKFATSHALVDVNEWDQGSQKGKRQNKYKSKKTDTYFPRSPQARREKQTARELEIPKSPDPTPRRKVSKQKLDPMGLSSPVKLQPTKLFRLEAEDDGEDNTTVGSKETTFSKPEGSRQRRGSSSSLSSADTFASFDIDSKTKARLTIDETSKNGSDDQIRCPRCRKLITKSILNTLGKSGDLSKMKDREQAVFCHDHRIHDAKLTWKEAGYPEIDFEALPTSDVVTKCIKNVLLPIIKRQMPSYYLSKLDAAAKGPQKLINKFFTQDVLDNIHHGYYGPNGAKVLSEAIVANPDVSKLLKELQKTDKAVRVAGLGRYIDSVLLPELLVKLTIKEMYLANTEEGYEEARKVLEQSSDIGVLLCGDDDDVDVGEEEGESQFL